MNWLDAILTDLGLNIDREYSDPKDQQRWLKDHQKWLIKMLKDLSSRKLVSLEDTSGGANEHATMYLIDGGVYSRELTAKNDDIIIKEI